MNRIPPVDLNSSELRITVDLNSSGLRIAIKHVHFSEKVEMASFFEIMGQNSAYENFGILVGM